VDLHLITVSVVWAAALFLALTVIMYYYMTIATTLKELWRILFAILVLYSATYSSNALFYTIVVLVLGSRPECFSFYGKSIPGLIGITASVIMALILNYISCLIVSRGNEFRAIKILITKPPYVIITFLLLLGLIYVFLGPSALYVYAYGDYTVYYDSTALIIFWTTLILLFHVLHVIYSKAESLWRVKEVISSLKIISSLIYAQLIIGLVAMTYSSIFLRSAYGFMNITWLIIGLAMAYIFPKSLLAPYIRYIEGYGTVFLREKDVEKREIEVQKILVEYDPKTDYFREVSNNILNYFKGLPVVIVGCLGKPFVNKRTSLKAILVPVAVSSLVAQKEGVSITNLPLILHTLLSVLSNIKGAAVIIIDDLTDLIVANDVKSVYMFLKQLFEHARTATCIALLNKQAVDENARALYEGIFDSIYIVNSSGSRRIK